MTEIRDDFSHYNVKYVDLRGVTQVVNIRAESARDALGWVKAFVAHKPGTARVVR